MHVEIGLAVGPQIASQAKDRFNNIQPQASALAMRVKKLKSSKSKQSVICPSQTLYSRYYNNSLASWYVNRNKDNNNRLTGKMYSMPRGHLFHSLSRTPIIKTSLRQ